MIPASRQLSPSQLRQLHIDTAKDAIRENRRDLARLELSPEERQGIIKNIEWHEAQLTELLAQRNSND